MRRGLSRRAAWTLAAAFVLCGTALLVAYAALGPARHPETTTESRTDEDPRSSASAESPPAGFDSFNSSLLATANRGERVEAPSSDRSSTRSSNRRRIPSLDPTARDVLLLDGRVWASTPLARSARVRVTAVAEGLECDSASTAVELDGSFQVRMDSGMPRIERLFVGLEAAGVACAPVEVLVPARASAERPAGVIELHCELREAGVCTVRGVVERGADVEGPVEVLALALDHGEPRAPVLASTKCPARPSTEFELALPTLTPCVIVAFSLHSRPSTRVLGALQGASFDSGTLHVERGVLLTGTLVAASPSTLSITAELADARRVHLASTPPLCWSAGRFEFASELVEPDDQGRFAFTRLAPARHQLLVDSRDACVVARSAVVVDAPARDVRIDLGLCRVELIATEQGRAASHQLLALVERGSGRDFVRTVRLSRHGRATLYAPLGTNLAIRLRDSELASWTVDGNGEWRLALDP